MTDLASVPSPGPAASDAGAARTVRRVDVVPHTHWDREWYSPYPTFRLRLVDLLDELLPRLEADTGFAHFQLDGQMAVVDDYLGLRPDEAGRLRSLAAQGRLSMGPWYVLPDEFLVSGETHVRNLQLGLRKAEAFGGAMPVGYLPDMFGHIAQMPQLLVQFGFTDAVVWRGVPSSIDGPQFWWIAPDGSRVRAEYLPAGYGNGSELPHDAGAVREKIEIFRLLQGPLVGDPLLLMAGMDHEVPPAHLSAVIAELNEREAARTEGDAYELTIRSLAEHLADAPTGHLPELHGEMRSGLRANVLMGVASNRVDVKQAAARAERTLERVAEPLAALWLGEPERWLPVFDAAWLDVIRNAAHDSICACSHDEVVDAVLHRYAESTRLAQGVADRAVEAAAARMASPGVVVLNATARPRTDVVEIDIPGPADGEPVEHPAVQVLAAVPAVEEIDGAVGDEAPMRLALAALAEHPDTRSIRIEDDGAASGATITAHLLADHADDAVTPADALALVGQRATEDPELALRLVVHRRDPSRHVLALAADVPGYGWARWEPVEPAHPVSAEGELGLANGLVTVVADPTDGTFSVDGVAGFGRLVDDGDAGDTYNWCPPEVDVVVDAPTSVEVTRTEAGPIRGRLVVRSTYVIPERCAIDGQEGMTTGWAGGETYRRVGEVTQVFTTTVEVRADDPTVRVTTSWDQRARDHRLRVHLPLPGPAASSRAEDAYAVVERPLWIEGGPNEWGVPTFPSRRFVQAGGLTVTHEGLCEYELVGLTAPDGTIVPDTTGMTAEQGAALGVAPPEGTTAHALALTLVRATGWLSRGPMPSRPQPAGPFDRLEGAQALRPLSLRYAIRLDGDDVVDPHALADHVWNPLLPAVAPGGGDLGDRGSRLQVDGDDGRGVRSGALDVDAVLQDTDGRLVVRAHATGDHGAVLALPGRTGAVVDLRGRELDTFTGVLEVDPHRIVTVRLD
ncbi:glycoside hydrolase family 38 N-terminal domain-containing protein [Dermatobacter hominis]|uniref:glycoside hydrolase family 38 N-terminal domain-containing protein n=1 Tax=Dermatobacter hominis TaxID=2884263 RepID=UPI001D110015|nr:hypothetical protein [Dermatobacter hominis]UDY37012.1 hypothetical protein LH044_05610 [Dermatobacter hominis]